MPNNIYITGSGFVAAGIRNYLDSRGIHSVRFSRNTTPKSDVTSMKYTDYDSVMRGFERHSIGPADIVVHTAGQADAAHCEADPKEANSANAVSTRQIALACRYTGASMIYISTANVYGNKEGPITEADSPDPLTQYAKTKRWGEEAVEELLFDAGRASTLRPTMIVGYNGRNWPNKLVGKILDSAYGVLNVPAIEHTTNHVWLNDVSAAVATIAGREPGTWHPVSVLNLGGPDRMNRAELTAILCGVLPEAQRPRLNIAETVERDPNRPSSLWLDSSEVEKMLGRKLTSIESAVAHMKYKIDHEATLQSPEGTQRRKEFV